MFWIILLLVTAFFMGASIGSFLGVVADRSSRQESFIRTPSHCINCQAKLKWYQNLPIISYIVLQGKCSNCKARIPIKLFVIELIYGIAAITLMASLIVRE